MADVTGSIATSGGIGATTQSTATRANAQLTQDYDAFLKLLTVQLQNQDPEAPMDSNEFVNQLAMFSQVEQSIQTNENISDLVQALRQQEGQAEMGMLGRDVVLEGDRLNLKHGQPSEFSVEFDSETTRGTITIADGSGRPIRTYPVGQSNGKVDISWDGKDSSGNEVSPGDYRILVEGFVNDTEINGRIYHQDRVDRVLLNVDGTAELLLEGGLVVAADQIRAVLTSSANQTNAAPEQGDTGLQETGLQETGTQEPGTQETGTQETGTQETGTQETPALQLSPTASGN